ncbi:hypothetical protein ACN28S_07455 [Cystobacter fuscus]
MGVWGSVTARGEPMTLDSFVQGSTGSNSEVFQPVLDEMVRTLKPR